MSSSENPEITEQHDDTTAHVEKENAVVKTDDVKGDGEDKGAATTADNVAEAITESLDDVEKDNDKDEAQKASELVEPMAKLILENEADAEQVIIFWWFLYAYLRLSWIFYCWFFGAPLKKQYANVVFVLYYTVLY